MRRPVFLFFFLLATAAGLGACTRSLSPPSPIPQPLRGTPQPERVIERSLLALVPAVVVEEGIRG